VGLQRPPPAAMGVRLVDDDDPVLGELEEVHRRPFFELHQRPGAVSIL
jgi:hypothetical protein